MLKSALEYNFEYNGLLTSASRVPRQEPFTWQKAIPARRVPRQGGLPCLACKRLNAFSKETYEKLALPR